MLDYHHDRASALLANATQIVTPEEVQAAVKRVAEQLNTRFNAEKSFPLVLGVMGGAVVVASIGFYFAKGRSRAWLGDVMRLPTATEIDRRLVLGGLAFGAGWGLAGYCPGPAIASLAQGGSKPVIFVLSMLAGMAVYEMSNRVAASRVHKRA